MCRLLYHAIDVHYSYSCSVSHASSERALIDDEYRTFIAVGILKTYYAMGCVQCTASILWRTGLEKVPPLSKVQ